MGQRDFIRNNTPQAFHETENFLNDYSIGGSFSVEALLLRRYYSIYSFLKGRVTLKIHELLDNPCNKFLLIRPEALQHTHHSQRYL